jgi:hypothetical protein
LISGFKKLQLEEIEIELKEEAERFVQANAESKEAENS